VSLVGSREIKGKESVNEKRKIKYNEKQDKNKVCLIKKK